MISFLGPEAFIPEEKLLVEYSTFCHEEYVVLHDKTIIGINREIREDSSRMSILSKRGNIREKFQKMCPQIDDSRLVDQHMLRRVFYRATQGRKSPVKKQTSGRKLLLDLLMLYGHQTDGVLLRSAAALCSKYGILLWQREMSYLEKYEFRELVSACVPSEEEGYLAFSFDIQELRVAIEKLMILYLIWKVLFWGRDRREESELINLLRTDTGKYGFGVVPLERFSVGEREATQYRVWENGVLSVKKRTQSIHRTGTIPSQNFFDVVRLKPLSVDDYRRAVTFFSGRNQIVAARRVEFHSGKPAVMQEYKSPIAAAYGVLLNLIEDGEEGLEGRTICQCKRCGADLIRNHRNRKLCDECRSGRQRQRAYRDRKRAGEGRELIEDGQESEQ